MKQVPVVHCRGTVPVYHFHLLQKNFCEERLDVYLLSTIHLTDQLSSTDKRDNDGNVIEKNTYHRLQRVYGRSGQERHYDQQLHSCREVT